MIQFEVGKTYLVNRPMELGIGFQVREAEYDIETGIRTIKKANLIEISAVPSPPLKLTVTKRTSEILWLLDESGEKTCRRVYHYKNTEIIYPNGIGVDWSLVLMADGGQE